ncbi:xylulokinase [Microbacterium excoecariae]|uniref:xylulokinase n=1 Tax=Microbacterium excoecariae TaxID=2715210 RepID=UPI00197C4DD5|nr:FGGY-family carbohydrate kinase [Microbacterium excoecariae]NHI16705.1 ATPase [Microbacterium excoecariae]
MTTPHPDAAIREGSASLGIELGSTRIKACLTTPDGRVIATGSHAWENQFVDGHWTYALEDVRAGVRAAYADLVSRIEADGGSRPGELAAIGVSAMMHGYLAFDAAGDLLVPFRTWRDVTTGPAAAELSDELDITIPLRWSVAHLAQAVRDGEEHVARVAHVTTLAGYVHELLTGVRALGIGDASGMFPIDSATGTYDADRLRRADAVLARRGAGHLSLTDILPEVRRAGEDAGRLTEAGARLLDPTGSLAPGALAAPPEGDAGTGMVATNAVTPRSGNVSAGTSIFGMVVLERPLARRHDDIDLVTTPAGDAVAMVHCNNGASETGAWVGVLREFAAAIGHPVAEDEAFAAFLAGALEPDADAGVLAYNHLSGEPVAGLSEGRPIVVRTPGSALTLAGLARAQVRGSFATLALGMRALHEEGVTIDEMRAHGGIFRTAGVAQRLLAAALGSDVVVGDQASEGGAWGMAVLAAYRAAVVGGESAPLADWIARTAFADETVARVTPSGDDIRDHDAYLATWEAGLEIERAAVTALPVTAEGDQA